MFRFFYFFCLAILILAGCESSVNFPYKVEVIQGSVITKEQVENLEIGMSKEEVVEILGSSFLPNTFNENRWDYIFIIKRQRGSNLKKQITVFFENNKLSKINSDELLSENEFNAQIGKKIKVKNINLKADPKKLENHSKK